MRCGRPPNMHLLIPNFNNWKSTGIAVEYVKLRLHKACLGEMCVIFWRFLTSVNLVVWPFELKISTPVTRTWATFALFWFFCASCVWVRNPYILQGIDATMEKKLRGPGSCAQKCCQLPVVFFRRLWGQVAQFLVKSTKSFRLFRLQLPSRSRRVHCHTPPRTTCANYACHAASGDV